MTDTMCETFRLDKNNMVLISFDDIYEGIIQARYKSDDLPQSMWIHTLRLTAFEIEKKKMYVSTSVFSTEKNKSMEF